VVEAPLDAGVELRAAGAFQRRNFALALAAAEALSGTPLAAERVRAAAAVTVPGRFQVIGHDPLTILDGAHNPGGVRALADSLSGSVVGVVSVLDDKDAAEMLRALIPHCAHLVCTKSANPRALSPATLASLTEQLNGPPTTLEADPHRALARARALAGAGGTVLATGSIYLVADLLRPAGSAARRSTL
jgi:dihydrofolate synthase/folylpolyglutamate synthase